MTYTMIQTNPHQKSLVGACYQAYIFFLLLGRIGTGAIPAPLQQYIFNSTSSILLYAGVFLILLSGRGCMRYPRRLKALFYLLGYMVAANIIMSIYLYPRIGTQYGETTFTAILGTTYHYIEAVMAITFNAICLTHYVSQERVLKLLLISSSIAVVVGYIQQAAYRGVPGFLSIYAMIEKPLGLSSSQVVLNRGFSCFGSEPASASQYLIVSFPTIVCCMNAKRSTYLKWFCRVLIVLFIVLFLTSTSSTVIILLVVSLISLCVYHLRNRNMLRIWMASVFILGFAYVMFYTYGNPENFSLEISENSDFLYNLIGKAFDTENQSTAHRIGSVIVDMKIFFSEFFLTGVGAGNQGFFYKQYIPSWCLISSETRALLSGNVGISNGGGSFFPVILSAYGVAGCVAFIAFIRRYIQSLKKNFVNEPEKHLWQTFFALGITNFLLDGWFTSGVVQSQPMAFLLALPFII